MGSGCDQYRTEYIIRTEYIFVQATASRMRLSVPLGDTHRGGDYFARCAGERLKRPAGAQLPGCSISGCTEPRCNGEAIIKSNPKHAIAKWGVCGDGATAKTRWNRGRI